jgi:hypothetical protein
MSEVCYEPCVQFYETCILLFVDCKKYCMLKSDVKIL